MSQLEQALPGEAPCASRFDSGLRHQVGSIDQIVLKMASVTSQITLWSRKRQFIFGELRKELSFFRIHVAVFVITPLVFSGIFYACNGEFKIAFIDALFLCYSAMTVTGLTTVNLSSLTGWQQAILFLLMLMGDVVRGRYIIEH